jgi:hypothetical protein
LSLRWHISELSVHVYFSILWENRYKISIFVICDGFIAQVYSLIFKQDFPRLSEETRKVISNIGHWYLEERSTYIIIFRATGAPHLLPIHVPDKLVLGGNFLPDHIARVQCFFGKRQEKGIYSLWVLCRLPFHEGHYTGQKRSSESNGVQVFYRRYRKHDPRRLVVEHANQVISHWPYAHDDFEDEIFTKNSLNWDEVL